MTIIESLIGTGASVFKFFLNPYRHIAYKFPNSFSYAFLSPDYVEWRLSSGDLRDNGFLMRTFNQVYNSTDTGLVYGMYNDEVPPNLTFAYGPWYGHMKGRILGNLPFVTKWLGSSINFRLF